MIDLPTLAPVQAQVARLTGGRRRARFLTVLSITTFWAACAIGVIAWLVAPGVLGDWALALGVGVVVVSLAAALLLPVDAIAIAKRYDDEVGTSDLLSSSLELQSPGSDLATAPTAGPARRAHAFVAAVREEATRAVGRDVRHLFPARPPRYTRWTWAPLCSALAAVAIDLGYTALIPEAPRTEMTAEVLLTAEELGGLPGRAAELGVAEVSPDEFERMKSLAERLAEQEISKRESMAENARLASQRDKYREEKEREFELEKQTAARLSKSEDAKDAADDMDAGRFREAANKVKKKLDDLERELREATEKKRGKIEIEALKRRIEKLKELLATLEKLDALGSELGFTLEVLAVLERLDGELGELREFDGDLFDEAILGRGPKAPRRPADGEPPDKIEVSPSNDAGKGHAKKILGDSRRSLSEGAEQEVPMTEGKGKSSFGQIRTANDGGRSRTAYQEAYLAARRAADDAIYRQDIPPGYRNYIRDYFDRMQPDDVRGAEDEPEASAGPGDAGTGEAGSAEAGSAEAGAGEERGR